MWYQAVEPDPATGRLPPPAEAEYPAPAITALHLGPACALVLAEGGRVFVHTAPAQGGPVVELRCGPRPPADLGATAPSAMLVRRLLARSRGSTACPPHLPPPFPTNRRGDDGEAFSAGAAALTPHFIVLGLPDGTLAFYDAASQALASEFGHAGGAITALFCSADCTL